MKKSRRITVPVGSELDKALKRESDKTGAPVTELVRRAAVEFLRARGYHVEDSVQRGGYRREDEPGQRAEVGTG